jgi:hypothetical protein
MADTKQIQAVEMVRRIRDELARELAGKSDADIIAFYRRAGDAARESARRGQPSNQALIETASGESVRGRS